MIVIGHGSRSEYAKQTFFKTVERLREIMDLETEGCFMEISEPRIPETISLMYKRGIREITVVPCFLFNGIHIMEDIPEILLAEKNRYADLKICMAQPIGYHESIADILKDRAMGELTCI